MADPVKIAPYEEEENDVRGPQVRPVQSPPSEERRTQERRKTPAGYFRTHPNAKWVVLVVLLVLIAAGIFVWHYYSLRESTDDAQVDGHIDPISARVSGTVLRVLADDNQFVKAGDLLVELDPKDYEIAVQRARADLADAQANATAATVNVPLTNTTSSSQLIAANAGVNAADKEVDMAVSRVQEAQANDNKVQADLKRLQTLVQKDEVSRQQYDAAVAAAAASRATLDAAKSAVASAQGRAAQARAQAASAGTVGEQLKVTRSRAGAAAAQVQKNQALLDMALLNLQYTKIVAPVAGILSKRNVEPGQVIQAGQPLFSIVNLDDIYVTANFKETQLKEMHPGQRVQVHVDAFGRDYNGTVESMGGATGARFSLLPPENATGNYVKVVQRIPVRIRIDKGQDPDHLLRPGMSVVPTVFVK
jgi:membrane fusion protein (multidrug efflux system)